jgi:hypothetical protein
MSMNGTPSDDVQVSNLPQVVTESADVMPASMSGGLMLHDEKMESRRRLVEARTLLFRTERDHMEEAGNFAKQIEREVRAIGIRMEQVDSETRAIEAEAQLKVRLLLRQAELERKLGERIRSIADRNALSILDRIKEASDSMMDWANQTANDLGMLMKEEAAGQVARKVNDINTIRDAMEDEERAAELIDLAGKLRTNAA